MWNKIIGKPNDAQEKWPSQRSRRKDDEQPSSRRRSQTVGSSNTNAKPPRGDDRERGFNPTSTIYSSTTQTPHPGAASASSGSSYAITSGKQIEEPYITSGLARNAGNADQILKSTMEQEERDLIRGEDRKSERRKERPASPDGQTRRKARRNSRERGKKRRDKRDKKMKESTTDRTLVEDKKRETTRGDFSNQIESPGFMQFPGQSGSGFVGGPPSLPARVSPHVPDQFPGQFPISSTEPYRPPLAVSEGGPGLAADYYGDAGESVATQPGVRPQPPALIIGAEPHLQPASSVVAPPPEPSASGHVGAAASFFDGSFEDQSVQASYEQQPGKPNRPSSSSRPPRPESIYDASPTSALPNLGAAAAGAAAGYYMGSQSSSQAQRPDGTASTAEGQSHINHRPHSNVNASFDATANYTQSSKPGKHSSHPSNASLYAAGAAGLAAASHSHNHPSNSQYQLSQPSVNGSMSQRHRHRGPLTKLVDFFRDPEGVAQFEEYTEYIGVCRDCFAPGSSPRDAPRKHYYRKRHSNERLGSSSRVDKDSRYWSSDSEKRRRNKKSWLEASIGGYGLAKVGEKLFKESHDFDDTYSVKTGQVKKSRPSSSPERKSRSSRGTTRKFSETKLRSHSSSRERFETGITGDGRVYRRNLHGGVPGSPVTTTYGIRRRSRSRSRSDSRRAGLGDVALRTTVGSSLAAGKDASRISHSNKNAGPHSHRQRERSRERPRRKRKNKGFFSFDSASSSSVDLDVASETRRDKRSRQKRRNSEDDHRKAELAVAGLGAAAAALALKESRHDSKSKRRNDLVAVKEPKYKNIHAWKKDERAHSEDDGWESASGDDESISSALAYGESRRRRGSQSSLSSDSSGTDKWGWRWGSRKDTKRKKRQQLASAEDQPSRITLQSNSSLPLQNVHPVSTSNPLKFDAGGQSFSQDPSHPIITARPGPVPVQHPQPVAAVPPTVYSTQAPHEHNFPVPTGPPVFSQSTPRERPLNIDHHTHIYNDIPSSLPGSFPEIYERSSEPSSKNTRLRRRASSPATYSASVSQPVGSRRQGSLPESVQFDLTEEQLERDRRKLRRDTEDNDERRRRRKRRESESESGIVGSGQSRKKAHEGIWRERKTIRNVLMKPRGLLSGELLLVERSHGPCLPLMRGLV